MVVAQVTQGCCVKASSPRPHTCGWHPHGHSSLRRSDGVYRDLWLVHFPSFLVSAHTQNVGMPVRMVLSLLQFSPCLSRCCVINSFAKTAEPFEESTPVWMSAIMDRPSEHTVLSPAVRTQGLAEATWHLSLLGHWFTSSIPADLGLCCLPHLLWGGRREGDGQVKWISYLWMFRLQPWFAFSSSIMRRVYKRFSDDFFFCGCYHPLPYIKSLIGEVCCFFVFYLWC